MPKPTPTANRSAAKQIARTKTPTNSMDARRHEAAKGRAYRKPLPSPGVDQVHRKADESRTRKAVPANPPRAARPARRGR